REPPDLGAEARVRDALHGLPVVVRDSREPCLDAVDPQLVEQARDFELLFRVEDDADRLLAVAQGRVVEADVASDAVRVVEGAGPDEVFRHVRTPPSGNGESFSAPASVIRKLSSTRRPPPPSQ